VDVREERWIAVVEMREKRRHGDKALLDRFAFLLQREGSRRPDLERVDSLHLGDRCAEVGTAKDGVPLDRRDDEECNEAQKNGGRQRTRHRIGWLFACDERVTRLDREALR